MCVNLVCVLVHVCVCVCVICMCLCVCGLVHVCVCACMCMCCVHVWRGVSVDVLMYYSDSVFYTLELPCSLIGQSHHQRPLLLVVV